MRIRAESKIDTQPKANPMSSKSGVIEFYRGAQIVAWPIQNGLRIEAWVRYLHPEHGHPVHRRVQGPTDGAFLTMDSLRVECRRLIADWVTLGEIAIR